MNNVVLVTGNQNKANYFAQLAGIEIQHHGIDQPEIQSLNLEEVVTDKAKAAFEILRQPVIVEDTALTIKSLGKLPGTFIKWFIEEIGLEKICRLADITSDRSAVAACTFAYYDGKNMQYFNGKLEGAIPDKPKGDAGFGWNPIFIPGGQNLTLGEMSEETFKKYYLQIKSIDNVGQFIRSLDNDNK